MDMREERVESAEGERILRRLGNGGGEHGGGGGGVSLGGGGVLRDLLTSLGSPSAVASGSLSCEREPLRDEWLVLFSSEGDVWRRERCRLL